MHWGLLPLPWLFFAVTWLVQTLVDYDLRMADGDVETHGMGEPAWFLAHAVWAVIAAGMMWRVLGRIPVWMRLVALAVQLALGFVVYAVACLAYVVGTGIDAL